MEHKNTKTRFENNVLWLCMNRPESLNAINSDLLNELDAFFDEISTRTDVRCLIITGEGKDQSDGKAFIAGADIAEMQNKTEAEAIAFSKKGQNVFKKIIDLPFPVIACINGYALGGGMELAMFCDIRIASDNAKFGQPEVGLGIIAGFGGTQILSRRIGRANAMYILFTGQTISAEKALEMGIIQVLTTKENLIEETSKIANAIAKQSPLAVAQTKLSILTGVDKSFEEGLDIESKLFGKMFESEAKIGMSAFLEKRKLNW